MGDPAEHALSYVRGTANRDAPEAEARLRDVLPAGNPSTDSLVAATTSNCRLTVNFHPDRHGANGTSVAEGLLRTGRYLPQAVTGLSSGARFAVPGGNRNLWETQMFDGAYDGQADSSRPIYGALDITHDPFGGSPRFGSCFLVLEPHCSHRATFCVGDSHVGPTDLGTSDSLRSVLAGLFEHARLGNALNRGISADELITHVVGESRASAPARDLDGYVEAQVHGGIDLGDDVATIVLDPSFHEPPVHEALDTAALTYGFELTWHEGSQILPDQIPPEFRGPDVLALADRIIRSLGSGPYVNAAAIGASAAEISFTPPSIDGDAPDSPFQQHKYLWHCLLHLGSKLHGLER